MQFFRHFRYLTIIAIAAVFVVMVSLLVVELVVGSAPVSEPIAQQAGPRRAAAAGGRSGRSCAW